MLRPPPYEYRRHQQIGGGLAGGTPVGAGATVSQVVPIAGAARVRLRLEADVAGDLDATYLRPADNGQFDPSILCGAGNPATVALVAGTEAVMEFDPRGEAYVLVEFTNTDVGAGTITSADIAQLLR